MDPTIIASAVRTLQGEGVYCGPDNSGNLVIPSEELEKLVEVLRSLRALAETSG